MTKKQVRDDLREIKYYYSHKSSIDKRSAIVGKTVVYDIVEKYNKAIRKAPCQLFELYAQIYIEAKSIVAVAQENSYSPDYLEKVHLELLNYLAKTINEETV